MAAKEADEISQKIATDASANIAPEHSPDHNKLLDKGLNVMIVNALDHIFKTNKLIFADLDKHAFEALKEFPSDGALTVLAQLADSSLDHISNKSVYLCDLLRAYDYKEKRRTSTMKETLNETSKYGPNPEIMADILDQSEYVLQVTASQRTLTVPLEDRQPSAEPSPGYEVFCLGIPTEIFEDELIQLFEDGESEVYEFRLMMDPVTEMNRGHAFITYAQKEDAERIQQKLNNFEIRPGQKLKVGMSVSDLRQLEMNKSHICKESSLSDYCSCINEMLMKISSLKEEIEIVERITDKKKVDEAKEMNKMQYACDSLRMEEIEPTAKSLKKIFNASDYATNDVDNITLEYILKIHKKIQPNIKEVGMFRDEDLYINGIYNVPVYPSDVDLVVSEMTELVKFLNDIQSVENDETAIIMAATAKTNFLLTHPFFDGNGRCSRVIFNAILQKRNFPWIAIPVSDSTRYYEALKFAQETTKDFTLIYRFMCRCIRRSLLAYLENLRS